MELFKGPRCFTRFLLQWTWSINMSIIVIFFLTNFNNLCKESSIGLYKCTINNIFQQIYLYILLFLDVDMYVHIINLFFSYTLECNYNTCRFTTNQKRPKRSSYDVPSQVFFTPEIYQQAKNFLLSISILYYFIVLYAFKNI